MNKIIIDLDVVMKEKGISKNSVCKNCNLQRTQLNNYCKNKISRIDLKILARLCEYLKCDLTDYFKAGRRRGRKFIKIAAVSV